MGYEGHVYVIHCAGRYKIGRTSGKVRARLKQIQIELPEPLTLICVISTNVDSRLESYLHCKFAPLHHHGEWFDLTRRDVKYLQAVAKEDPARIQTALAHGREIFPSNVYVPKRPRVKFEHVTVIGGPPEPPVEFTNKYFC